MNSPSREQLLGFLLGALEPAEEEQVAIALDHDPALRAELRRLQGCLGQLGLDEPAADLEPPPDLANRTCEFVAAHATDARITPATVAARYDAPPQHHVTWSDLVAMAAVCLAAASLFFPALSFSRFQAQIASCQNQLRLIGIGLHGFSELQPDHTFPGPDLAGKRAVAGVVASTLFTNTLADSWQFLCPASSAIEEMTDFRVPLLVEVDRAEGQELKRLQRTMGGHYGYNLGYLAGSQLERPRDLRRPLYAMAGDAPSNAQPRRVSANHLGRGQNVLYEDGRVQFLAYLPARVLDDPYHNREGWVAAGVDPDDAVLGASSDPPLPVTLVSEQH
jgi:hypothetical protein